jgi:hypothetical protein
MFVVYCTNYIPHVRLRTRFDDLQKRFAGSKYDLGLFKSFCQIVFTICSLRFDDSFYNKLDVFDANRQIFFFGDKKIILDSTICGTNSQP